MHAGRRGVVAVERGEVEDGGAAGDRLAQASAIEEVDELVPNLRPRGSKGRDDVAADEAAGSGYEHAHEHIMPRRRERAVS